ncbi:MAG: diguanylate cyclase [Coriobacteriia bacterium]|nr:diguanylate cyclase [Coriobacteriia bacterium]
MTDMNAGVRRRPRRPRLVLAGFVSVVVLWFAEAMLHSSIAGTGYLDELLRPTSHALAFRILVSCFIIAGTIYTQRLFDHHARTETSLAFERQKIGLVYDNSPDAILVVDSDYVIRYANSRAVEHLGVNESEMLGQTCHAVSVGDEKPCDGCRVRLVMRTGKSATAVRQRTTTSGHEQWVEQTWYPVPDEEGGPSAVVEISRDITEIKRTEMALQLYSEKLEDRVRERTGELQNANTELQDEVAERRRVEKMLRESEERFRNLVELAPDLILVHIEGIIAFMNPYGASLLGYANPADMVGIHVLELVHPDDREAAAARIRLTTQDRKATGPIELRFQRADGTLVYLEIAATPLTYHGRPAVQAVAHDVTSRRQAEETIRHMAYYDMLTGLPNRALFDDRLAVAINRADREGKPFALMFMDMNDFKIVNDTLGHAAGDQLLAEVAERLVSVVRKSDTVARLGGDEFTLLLPNAESRETVEPVIRKIISALAEPALTSQGPVDIDMSIGIAFYPEDGLTFSELMHAADMAMYQAKTDGDLFRFAHALDDTR